MGRLGRIAAAVVVAGLLAAGLGSAGRDQVTAPTTETTAVATIAAAPSTTPSTTAPPSTPTTTTTLELWGVPASVAPEEPPDPWIDPAFTGLGTVVVARGGADLADTPGGTPTMRVREGLTFAARSWDGEWIEVFTTCSSIGYVHRSEVRAEAAAPNVTIGPGFDFSQAVVVIDPGHGGPRNIGGVGPEGTLEKEIVLDIARRVRDLLAGAHFIDWSTGDIYAGGPIPPAGRVIMTRTGADADYEVQLDARAAIANAANAQALVSIHANAGWVIELDHPGSDVYYQSQPELEQQSRRLARLLVEEFQRSFDRFDANWTGDDATGAKSRMSRTYGGRQFYGILRHSHVPAVIAEGVYIDSATQEQLLLTPEFRQAYADAVYRGLVRFLTTDEPGDAPASDPVLYSDSRRPATPAGCVIPSQP